jgi:hypothetical protein
MQNGCRQSAFAFASSLDTRCRWPEVCRNGDKTEALSLVISQDTRGKEKPPLSHSQHTGAGRKSPPPTQLIYLNEAHPLLGSVFSACASMKFSTENRLIKVYFAVPDLHIVSTIRTGTHPGLVVNRGPLTTKVRQRHQIPFSTFLTLRERTGFQVPPPQLVYLLIKTSKYILSEIHLQGYSRRQAKFSEFSLDFPNRPA